VPADRDFGFADVRKYPPADFEGVVVFEMPRHASASIILQLIEQFLDQKTVLQTLTGRVAGVSPGRMRLRPRFDQ
jgi:hypothetical protein